MRRLFLLHVLLLLTACQAPDPVIPTAAFAQPSVPVAGFDMVYDQGRLFVIDQGRVAQFASDSPLATQSSGSAGTTTPVPDTVLLHQTTPVSAATRDANCNAAPFGDPGLPSPFRGVCVPIQLINGYADYVLNAYVQLIALAPCGTTTSVATYVKSESNSEIGVSNALGLWLYNSVVYPTGDAMGRDRYAHNWYFATDQPGATACFRFTAVVMGQRFTP